MPNTYCFAEFRGDEQNDFKGESKQEHMEKLVEVQSISFGGSAGFDPIKAKSADQVGFSDLSFSKWAGASTINFMRAALTVESINATFHFWRKDKKGKDEEWLKITVGNAVVTSHSLNYAGDEDINEVVALEFERIEIENVVDSGVAVHAWKKQD